MGYVFTREGLRRLYEKMMSKECPMVEKSLEDQEFGKCLADNVLQVNTLDEQKRHRFFHQSFDPEISQFGEYDSVWIREHVYYPFKKGLDCCSPTHIATHHIGLDIMYLFDYLIKNVSIFGLKKYPKFVLPKKWTKEEIAMAVLDVDFWNRTH
jgi:hypothetical protein